MRCLPYLRLAVVVYPNDHRPAYVIGSGREAVFELRCPSGPASLRENFDFAHHELRSIQKELGEHIIPLCQAWEKIHGHG